MNNRVYQALREGATLVTAGNRLARTLRRRYDALEAARGAKAWPAPAILPWSGWMDALWEQYLYSAEAEPPVRINGAQEGVLWESLVRDSGELLQSAAAASRAREAWALINEWRLDLDGVEAQGNEDARVFAGWARRFQKFPWLEEARLPDFLRTAMPPPAQRILLAGFEELTPQQKDFLAACAVETLPATESLEGSAARVAFPDGEQELMAAARWARALLEGGAREIGVVVPDLTARREAVVRIFREAQVPINVSAGLPLADYPVVACALSVLHMDPEENDWTLLGTLARAPYLAGGESERTRRGLLDAQLRKRGQVNVPLALWRDLAREYRCPVLARALGRWLRVRATLGAEARPSQWSRTFGLLLRACGWPGDQALASAEYQTVEAWSKTLSEFAALDLVTDPLGFREAVALLRRIAAERTFQPESGDAPVQVLGVLEASGLRFEHLWIAGLDDEAWPGAPNPNPFIPVRLQRARGLPRCSPERELHYAARMTRLLLAAAPNVIVSHPLRNQDAELAPSPLIRRVTPVDASALRLAPASPHRDIVRESGRPEELEDHQGPPVSGALQRGGTRVFQYQAACPFRAFAELRLGAKQLEEPAPGLDQRVRGNLVHWALEHAWKRLRTHAALCACADLDAVGRDAAAAALAELDAPPPPRFAELERRRLEAVVLEWLELEKQRPPFEVVEPEAGREVQLGGIRCQVRLDRIDRLPDGREIIIDYKTGKQGPGDWSSERPNEPQLPLYAVTHQGAPLAGVLFGRVRAGESGFAGFVDEDVAIPGARRVPLAEVKAAWRETLEALAADFRSGRAEAHPNNEGQSCRRCELAPLCRIAEYDEACEEIE